MTFLRILARALLIVAGLWTVYLIAANGWLLSGGYRRLLAPESDVDGWVDSAFTTWPGVIEGRGYHLVVHDPAVEAHLTIERFRLVLDPTDLVNKTVHMPRVRGHGVSFRLRSTRPLDQLCGQPPGLPPIPGQADPPGAGNGDCRRQEDTARKPGKKPEPSGVIRVDLSDVVADPITEIWIERVRVKTAARLEGGWWFWPTVETKVDLARLDVDDARAVGPHGVRGAGLGLSLTATVGPLRFREMSFDEMRHQISVSGHVELPRLELGGLRVGRLGERPKEEAGTATLAISSGGLGEVSAEIGSLPVALEPTAGGRLKASFQLSATSTAASVIEVRAPWRMDGERQRYPETAMFLRARPARPVEIFGDDNRVALDFAMTRAGPLVDLVPGFFPSLGAQLLIDDGDEVRAQAWLHGGGARWWLERVRAHAGNLDVRAERLELLPRPRGEVTLEAGPLSITRSLGGDSR